MDPSVNEELVESDQLAIRIDSDCVGIRLDHLLAQTVQDTSRTRISSSVKAGMILVNGLKVKSGYRLKLDDLVTGSLYEPPPVSVSAEEIQFPILFEDEHLLVISKPPGLVVHPGSGNTSGTLVNGLVYHCREIAGVGDEIRPGIVHRLDKDTSGVMVVAKNDRIHRQLVELFKSREVEKEYIALVHGNFDRSSGRIVAPIGRHPVHRQKMAVREGSGRYAVSNWQVIEEFDQRFSKVQVHIETGRTHQIRVHMAYLKHPVVGDTLYGAGRDNSIFSRQMLHALRLSFVHPASGELLSFTAPIWNDMEAACRHLREISANQGS